MSASGKLQVFLNKQLNDFKLKNPKFSQRAFAKKLGISQGALSEILKGKRILSFQFVSRILDQFSMPQDERQEILKGFLQKKDVPDSLKFISKISFPANPDTLDEARFLIGKFGDEIAQIMSKVPTNEVYELIVELYPKS